MNDEVGQVLLGRSSPLVHSPDDLLVPTGKASSVQKAITIEDEAEEMMMVELVQVDHLDVYQQLKTRTNSSNIAVEYSKTPTFTILVSPSNSERNIS